MTKEEWAAAWIDATTSEDNEYTLELWEIKHSNPDWTMHDLVAIVKEVRVTDEWIATAKEVRARLKHETPELMIVLEES